MLAVHGGVTAFGVRESLKLDVAGVTGCEVAVNGLFHPLRHIWLVAVAYVSASEPPEATAPEPRIVRPRRQRNV